MYLVRDDTERLRAELEGIGIGFEDFEQQAARFQRLARLIRA
jgi:hypothetical protein